ncbi:MAG: HDOD domain-containing protein [Planctomycetota bacterium]
MSTERRERLPKTLYQEALAVRPLTTAATEALVLLQNDAWNAEEVAALVRLDPLTTAEVLCLSNTSTTEEPIAEVAECLSRLGQAASQSLLEAASNRQEELPNQDAYGLLPNTFWVHSLSVGVLAEGLAAKVGGVEDAFVAGLLHDIGRIPMSRQLDRQYPEFADQLLASPPQVTSIELETKLLGYHHAEVGAELLRSGRLPEAIAVACEFQHLPSQAPEPHRRLAAIVHTADLYAASVGLGAGTVGLRQRIDPEGLEALGLGPMDVEPMLAAHVEEVAALTRIWLTDD